MKTLHLFFACMFLLTFGCEQTSENEDVNDSAAVEVVDNSEEEALAELDKASVKYQLLGVWEAKDDPTLRVKISALKYKTFDINTQVWDQAWDLTDGPDIESAYKNDNGDYIWVYDADDNAFYITKIISLNDKELTTSDIKGGREGMSRSYIKIE